MLELFRIAGRIELEGADKAERDIDDIDKKAGGLASKLGNVAKGIGKSAAIIGGSFIGVSAAIGGMATPMVNAAADLQALNAQFEQVFQDLGDMAQDTVNDLGKQFGMLPNRIKPSFTQTTSMFKGLGLDTEEAMSQAENAVTLVADAAAFYDKSFEDANSALNSFIKGNYEGGESIGLFANETQLASWAAKNLGLDWQNLDEAGKQIARLEYASAMQDAAGATGQASRESGNLQNVMGNLKQAWTDLMAKFGEPLLEPVVGWIQKLVQWLSEVDFQPFIDGFSWMVDMIAEGIGNAVGWLQELIGWFKNLYTNNQETFNGIWETIQNTFNTIWEFIQEIWGLFRTFWEENGQAIFETALLIFNGIKDTVTTAFQGIWEVIQNVMNLVSPFIQEMLARIQTFWNENGAQIMQAVQNAFQFIQGIIEFIMPIITKVIEIAWGFIKTIIDGALNVIMGLIKIFSGIFTGDWGKIWDGVKQIVGGILDTVVGIFGNIFSAIGDIMGSIWDTISGAFNKVVDFLKGLGKTFLDAGKGLIENLIKGIKNMIGKVTDTVKGIAQKVRDFLPFSPAKVGPLSDLDKLDFEGPITDSIKKGERGIQKGMADLLNMAEPSIDMNVGSRGMSQAGTSQQTTTNHYADMFRGMFEGANFQVRSDNDIKELARQFGDYISTNKRKTGVVSVR
jgi:ElaB/YqjD/DUF883 family membrane-anchored ribosome-binding protein